VSLAAVLLLLPLLLVRLSVDGFPSAPAR